MLGSKLAFEEELAIKIEVAWTVGRTSREMAGQRRKGKEGEKGSPSGALCSKPMRHSSGLQVQDCQSGHKNIYNTASLDKIYIIFMISHFPTKTVASLFPIL